jgi:hypothetical protein
LAALAARDSLLRFHDWLALTGGEIADGVSPLIYVAGELLFARALEHATTIGLIPADVQDGSGVMFAPESELRDFLGGIRE